MKSLNNKNIAFIGLGLMGAPMARNLKKAGACVHVFNRSSEKTEALKQEGFDTLSCLSQATACEFIICMVSDTQAVEQVLFAKNGVLSKKVPGTVFIDMGTTEISATRSFASQLEDSNMKYIDAPVSGGEIGAIDATLSIMVGAKQADFEQALPVFEALGSKIIHVGDVGCGQIAKAANQIIVGLNIGAVAEAFALARDGGADLNRVWEALSGGFADSKILRVHGKRMIENSFKPGGKATTQHKDLSQALKFAEENGTQLPSTELCLELYRRLIDKGDGALDHSALFRLF